MAIDPRPPTRAELSRFLPDQRSVRAFEKLFEIIPSDLIELFRLHFTYYTNVTQDHVTQKNEVVICNNTAPILVTLNANPEDGERVKVKRRMAIVTVIGMVDGDTNPVIVDREDGWDMVYSSSLKDWSKV